MTATKADLERLIIEADKGAKEIITKMDKALEQRDGKGDATQDSEDKRMRIISWKAVQELRAKATAGDE